MANRDPHLVPQLGSLAQGPEERRWWRLLDALPHALSTVHCWDDPRPLPVPRVRMHQFTEGGHLHASPTVIACLAGVVRVVRPGTRLDLGPGEVLLIAPGVWHTHEPLRAGAIRFGQGFLAAWSDVLVGDRDHSWSGRVPSQPSRRLLDAALVTNDLLKRKSAFLRLLSQVLTESVAHHAFAHPALRAMLDRMWSNIHLGVTVEELVEASGLSRAQAYRIFAAGYGVPPKEALATARLWLAAQLVHTGVSVAETAERCGFPSAATFARAWKQAYGISPRASHGHVTPD